MIIDPMDVLADLDARGLLHATTDREALAARLAEGPVTLYYGCDPTADSLHVGNLIGLLVLRRFAEGGHHAVALAGGATGMVGDPSGRSDERNLLDEATLRSNVASIKAEIGRVLGDAVDWDLVDNLDWTGDLRLLDFLREVGKHATVNQMVARESVKARMTSEHGISYTEFSYMLLQANDYRWLHEHRGVELQVGGSDQWGNILSGVDLIRRSAGATAHALCWPLLTAPDGTKLGKTTGARVWLSPERTLPADFYQHFLRTDDRQVRQFLLWFTLLPVTEIDALVAEHSTDPGKRVAQRALARAVTELVHGPAGVAEGERSEQAWKGGRDTASLAGLEGQIDTTHLAPADAFVRVVELLVRLGLTASNGEGARLIKQRGVRLNDTVVESVDHILQPGELVDGRLLVGLGKHRRHLVVVRSERRVGIR